MQHIEGDRDDAEGATSDAAEDVFPILSLSRDLIHQVRGFGVSD